MCAQLLSHVQLFATPWTTALEASLSVEFHRQEYWSRLKIPTPGDLPDPGVEPASFPRDTRIEPYSFNVSNSEIHFVLVTA